MFKAARINVTLPIQKKKKNPMAVNPWRKEGIGILFFKC